jgi:hypothetical protein
MRHTTEVNYWLAGRQNVPFGDELTPTYYKLTRWRGSEKFGYTTPIGYQRHVSYIVREIQANGRIIQDLTYVGENKRRVIVYYPDWTRGTHAMPHAVVIPACEIDED